jgi:hypothetical protein
VGVARQVKAALLLWTFSQRFEPKELNTSAGFGWLPAVLKLSSINIRQSAFAKAAADKSEIGIPLLTLRAKWLY